MSWQTSALPPSQCVQSSSVPPTHSNLYGQPSKAHSQCPLLSRSADNLSRDASFITLAASSASVKTYLPHRRNRPDHFKSRGSRKPSPKSSSSTLFASTAASPSASTPRRHRPRLQDPEPRSLRRHAPPSSSPRQIKPRCTSLPVCLFRKRYSPAASENPFAVDDEGGAGDVDAHSGG